MHDTAVAKPSARQSRLLSAGRLESILVHGWLILAIAVTLFPFVWAIATSFKTENQLLIFPPTFIPAPFVLDNYARAWDTGMGRGLLNSVIVSGASVISTLTIGALAAYSLGRLRWRGQGLFLLLIIAPMMIPGLVLLVPTYIIVARMNLLDTYFVLILLYTVRSLPLTVWIMRGFFESLPRELEEAAYMDGASRTQTLVRIILPLSQPALAATALIVFLNSWNDFILAVTMTSEAAMRTIQVALYFNIGEYGVDWTALMAAAVITFMPMLALFVALQGRFVSGLTKGALKG